MAPHEAVTCLNRKLVRYYRHRGDFVTAIDAVYDPAARDRMRRLLAEVEAFAGGEALNDDRTVVVLRGISGD